MQITARLSLFDEASEVTEKRNFTFSQAAESRSMPAQEKLLRSKICCFAPLLRPGCGVGSPFILELYSQTSVT